MKKFLSKVKGIHLLLAGIALILGVNAFLIYATEKEEHRVAEREKGIAVERYKLARSQDSLRGSITKDSTIRQVYKQRRALRADSLMQDKAKNNALKKKYEKINNAAGNATANELERFFAAYGDSVRQRDDQPAGRTASQKTNP